ncbi:SDR family NAD(P)-dependent oxidoreductase [Ostreiculturibacter nitratireducens]|uniref:SDR family NAD(P)-dependent oxidoreductase n=1 Tax=Ostreiculturibacter nitratireducens TaxID=3075226 RepID=UPI0031B61831
MRRPLENRIAVVTGGARGLGRGIARRLADDGARVIVWDIAPAAFDPVTAGFDPLAMIRVDVTDEAAVAAAAEESLTHGAVSILVNNAGMNGPVKQVADYDYATWRKVMAVNLDSVFLVSRAFVPRMVAEGHGRIVNVASIAGKEGVPGIAAYASAKAGVIGFTKSLARELVTTGVTVNAVAPVMVETDLLKEMTPEHIAASKAKIPMQRFLTIEELAGVVAFAAGPDCSFTTGFTFDASGGRATY